MKHKFTAKILGRATVGLDLQANDAERAMFGYRIRQSSRRAPRERYVKEVSEIWDDRVDGINTPVLTGWLLAQYNHQGIDAEAWVACRVAHKTIHSNWDGACFTGLPVELISGAAQALALFASEHGTHRMDAITLSDFDVKYLCQKDPVSAMQIMSLGLTDNDVSVWAEGLGVSETRVETLGNFLGHCRASRDDVARVVDIMRERERR